MLRAVIFDFNGVLIDDEPVHLEMFQKVLKDEGLSLDAKDYYEHYLGFDDRGCFKAYYKRAGHILSNTTLVELVQRKARYYRESIENRMVVFPGVKQLIPELSAQIPLAIASGALRSEIELILEKINLRNHFQGIVAAEDVNEGKPNPEIYNKALDLLNQAAKDGSIVPSDCLAIEDSREGIRAAHGARLKCLAITNSHSENELSDADCVVQSLEHINFNFLQNILSNPNKSA